MPPREWIVGLVVMFHPAQDHSPSGLVGAIAPAFAHIIAGRRGDTRDGEKFDGRDLMVEWGFGKELDILERENKKDYSRSDFGPPEPLGPPPVPGP